MDVAFVVSPGQHFPQPRHNNTDGCPFGLFSWTTIAPLDNDRFGLDFSLFTFIYLKVGMAMGIIRGHESDCSVQGSKHTQMTQDPRQHQEMSF